MTNGELGIDDSGTRNVSFSDAPQMPETVPEHVTMLILDPRSQHVDEGQNAKFKVAFEGSSAALSWSLNGKRLQAGSKYKMYQEDGHHFLEVCDVVANDSGTYTAIFDNSTVTDSAELVVKEKPKPAVQSETSPPPAVTSPLKNMEVVIGDRDVKLRCEVSNGDGTVVTWYHNGQKLQQNSQYRMMFKGMVASLVLTQIAGTDAGEYRCVVKNAGGQSVTSCIVSTRDAEVFEPPVFVQELHDMEVESGDEVEIVCEVEEHEHVDKPDPSEFHPCPKSNNILQRASSGTLVCHVAKDSTDQTKIASKHTHQGTVSAVDTCPKRSHCEPMTECEVKEKTGGPGTFPLSRNPIVRGSVKKTREFFEKQASASSDREVTKTNASPHAVPPVLKKSPSSASTLPTALSNRNISIPKDTSVKETTLTRDSRPAVGITDRSRSRSKVENMWQHYDKTKNKIFHSQRYTSVSNDNCGQLAAGMMDSRNVVKTHPSGNRLKSSTMTKFHSFREAYKQDYECALSRKTGGDSVRRSKSVECTVNRRYIFKNIKSIFEKPFTGTKGLKVKTVSELPTHSVPFLVSEIKERDSIDNEQSMIKTISQNACVFVGTKKPAAVDFTREDPISTEITEPNFSCEMNKSTSPVNGSNTIRAENAQKAKVCALKIESTFRRDTKDLASSMPTVVANAELTQVIPTYHDTEIVDQADFNDVTITECKVISNDVTEATPDLTTSNTMSSSCFPEAVMSFAKDDIDQFIPHHLCQLKYAAESEDREWAGNTEDLQVPKVEGQQDKQRVTYGGRAVLQCHVVGHPLPDIAWTLNHSVIKPSRYFQQSYKDSIAQLVVAEAFSEDEGEYTCSATNMAGNDSSSCFLVVEEKLPFTPHKVTLKTDTKFEDHYCYLNELGKGKFGSVFKCQEKKTGKLWAAKLLKVRSTQKEAVRMEVDIMNKLIHPKLLMLWDAFEAARTMVLVMEFVGAGELFERVIREDFVLTERDCVHFMRQICCGVGYMHSQSILHLDLKPENILCVSHNSNEIKIIDFGLARHYKEGDSLHILCGTPEFVAPEVVGYDDISFATDMWSVGVICYVLLSGLSPFLGDTEAETLTNVTSGDFDFDDDNFDGISDNAKDFIIQLLIKQKEKRHSVKQCEHHSWLAQDTAHIGSARLSTNNLKSYMARRKWQKTGNAIRALGRMSSLQRSTSIGSGSNSCGSDSMSVQKDVSCPDGVTLDSSFRQQVSGGLLASLEQEREQQAPEPPAEQNTQQQVSEPPAEQNTPQQTSEPPVSLQQRQ